MWIVFDRENGTGVGPFESEAKARIWATETSLTEEWADPAEWAEYVEVTPPTK